jgi:CRP-like cAMP-binding protein
MPEPPVVIERRRIVLATSLDDNVVEEYLRPPSTSTMGNIQWNQSLPPALSTFPNDGVTQKEEVNPTDSFVPDDTVSPVVGDQSADALIDAALLQIVRAQDGFTSRYDRALRIFQLANSGEDMANPVALTIRDAVHFMVERVSSLVIAVDGAPPDELPEGHLMITLSFTKSELLFVCVKTHPYFCHFPINLGEMEGTYIGALTHDAVILGVLSWLVEKRSDVVKRRFHCMPAFEVSVQDNHNLFNEVFPVIGDQSADALIDAPLLQIVRGQDGFTSRYDRALRIFQLASSREDMANLVALIIRDAVRSMVERVSRLVIAVDGAPPDELPEGHLVNNLCFTKSELLFVSIRTDPYFCHFPIILGELEGTYIGALIHDAVIVGVLSWLVEKRSDVAKRRFHHMPVFEFSVQDNPTRTWYGYVAQAWANIFSY